MIDWQVTVPPPHMSGFPGIGGECEQQQVEVGTTASESTSLLDTGLQSFTRHSSAIRH
jgi:hypothetical protein